MQAAEMLDPARVYLKGLDRPTARTTVCIGRMTNPVCRIVERTRVRVERKTAVFQRDGAAAEEGAVAARTADDDSRCSFKYLHPLAGESNPRRKMSEE